MTNYVEPGVVGRGSGYTKYCVYPLHTLQWVNTIHYRKPDHHDHHRTTHRG
jgi:hypothetical protein